MRTPPARKPPQDPLPHARAWLLRRVPGCRPYGEYLRLLLEEPEMAALIEAAPQLRPILRPLWRMLRLEPAPALLRNPAPPSRRRKRRRRRSPRPSQPHPTLRATLPRRGYRIHTL